MATSLNEERNFSKKIKSTLSSLYFVLVQRRQINKKKKVQRLGTEMLRYNPQNKIVISVSP